MESPLCCTSQGKPRVNLERNADTPTFHDFAGTRINIEEVGGREGIRTPGLLVANEALSQLSYSPTSSKSILAKAQVLANTRSTARKHVGAQHVSGLGRDTCCAPDIETNSPSGSYGCSTGPPARWATIFLAFW